MLNKRVNNLGISVYPNLSSLDEIKDYFKLASSLGFTRVFSSIFAVDGTKDEVVKYFSEFIAEAHKYGMTVALDVQPESFEKLGASVENLSAFKEMKVDILRLDLSFDLENNIKITNNTDGIIIEFNASVMPIKKIKTIAEKVNNQNNIQVCHNFYPQRYSGMKWEKFKNINKEFKKLGISIGAFISSNAENTHGSVGAKHGLPTVERHRNLPIDLQFRELLVTGDVDDIIIGNAYATPEELSKIIESLKDVEPDENKYPIIKIKKKFGATDDMFFPQHKVRINLNKDISDLEREVVLDYFPHSDVGDCSEWLWRSRMSRFIYKNRSITPTNSEKEFFGRGDLVIVNDNRKEYLAEVQVVLKPIENDGERNLIGHLDENEVNLLESVPDGEIVVFINE